MFLSKHPTEILEAGEQLDVPMMMGATRHDGTFPTGVTYNRFLNCPECGSLQNNATFMRKELVPKLLHSMGLWKTLNICAIFKLFLRSQQELFSKNFGTYATVIIDFFLNSGVNDNTYAVYDAIARKYFKNTKDSGDFFQMLPSLIDVTNIHNIVYSLQSGVLLF